MYTEDELVGIAKRDNNKKRTYLVVNRQQGKHVPASPGKILKLFRTLAGVIREAYEGERLLLIGFAETATAIGSAAAVELGCAYIQTTREEIESAEYLYFSESHSHATEQSLVKNELGALVGNLDRIIFIEDEVTTGNTIRKIVDILEAEYRQPVSFAVASLLNGMDEESKRRYEEKKIALHYLVKTDHSAYADRADRYSEDGTYVGLLGGPCEISELCLGGRVDARVLTDGKRYRKACEELWNAIEAQDAPRSGSRVLVLGTEEFMYPALFAAEQMEKNGCEVRFHATTRSPISVSQAEDYPLHKRYELRSLYDSERTTFVYELTAYDKVYIITDAGPGYENGLESLAAALRDAGNKEIQLIRWRDGGCDDEKFI